MKKLIFTLLATVLIISAFSQTSPIKNYPLKDYIAPEIKYRTLGLGTSLRSNGASEFSDGSVNAFNFNGYLNYYEYLNTSRHQGITNANFNTTFNTNRYKKDTIKSSSNRLHLNLNYWAQNRFYYKKKNFIGVHGNLSYSSTPLNKYTGEDNLEISDHHFEFTPYISMGKGRVQPVESARKAMDILLSLEKNNRLAISPDETMIDSLASLANRIRYKRFFDSRFKNIYQLEELDKAVQDLGLVDSLDIVYFANLNDIWNYAPNFNRGSGTRFEGGIIPSITYYHSKYEDEDTPRLSTTDYKDYGIYGFFSFNRMKPMSFAWQSDLMIDLTLGYNKEKRKYDDDESDPHETSTDGFNTALTASWQLGYFPNTRTFAGITPYVGVSNTQDFENDNNEFGVNTGLDFKMYYYFSPRLRFTFQANVSYFDKFAHSVPTPFWNTVSLTSSRSNMFQTTDDVTTFPINAYKSGNKNITYRAVISLTYAIF